VIGTEHKTWRLFPCFPLLLILVGYNHNRSESMECSCTSKRFLCASAVYVCPEYPSYYRETFDQVMEIKDRYERVDFDAVTFNCLTTNLVYKRRAMWKGGFVAVLKCKNNENVPIEISYYSCSLRVIGQKGFYSIDDIAVCEAWETEWRKWYEARYEKHGLGNPCYRECLQTSNH